MRGRIRSFISKNWRKVLFDLYLRMFLKRKKEMEENKRLYPVKFLPFAERASWGGTALAKVYNQEFYESDARGNEYKLDCEEKVGESWCVADMGFRDSVVRNGWLAGNTISELMEMYLDGLVGEMPFSYFGRQFPVMVKILDVRGKTPLLVHPSDDIAAQRYDTLGKKKLWYIMDAEPGAKLYMGFKEKTSPEIFYNSCNNNSVEGLLNAITPNKGDVFIINPGLVHAACSGVVIVEISESSDLDFKLYNYGLPTENDGNEPLTLVEAFDFIDFNAYDHNLKNSYSKIHHEHHHHDIHPEDRLTDKLVASDEFTVTKIRLSDALHIYAKQFDSFIIYTCIEGAASIQVPTTSASGKQNTDNYTITVGETILVPAEIEDFFLVPMDRSTILLETMIEEREERDSYIEEEEHHECRCNDKHEN